jgi:hypothetical protein
MPSCSEADFLQACHLVLATVATQPHDLPQRVSKGCLAVKLVAIGS